MPEILTYTPGQTFQAKVIRKDENVKTWQAKGKPVYRHDIYLEDPKTKVQTIKEWVSDYPSIPLTYCIEGVIQWFRITKVTEGKNDQIEPYDPESTRSPLARASDIATALPKGAADDDVKKNFNCNEKNISGKSTAFAYAYVKDLLVAEISLKPAGFEVDEAFIERYILLAGKVESGICELLNF